MIRQLDAQATHWTYFQWRDESRSLAKVTAYREARGMVGGALAPEYVSGAEVTAAFFSLFGVQPVLGRTFTAEEQEPTGPPVVLLSHGFWQERFGAEPGIVGRSLVMDGAPVTIVGVLPASFDFPTGGRVWKPPRPPAGGGPTTSRGKPAWDTL